MLEIELRVMERGLRWMSRYSGQLECVRGGRHASYRAVLQNRVPSSDGLVRIGLLEHYPRWSEPIEALVARGIAEAVKHYPERVAPPFRLMSVSTTLRGTLVSELQATYYEERLFAGTYEIVLPPSMPLPGL